MTGDGGLIALSVEEARVLLDWHAAHLAGFGIACLQCEGLADRLREWLDRHSEATP